MAKLDIRYIRNQVPSVAIPPYRGTSFEELIPDTYDIAERIELAVNGVTGPTDPDADHELYFWADFFHNPPILWHSLDDWCQPKLMEALPLLRTASGSAEASHVDQAWQIATLRSIGPDGLSYLPLEGRPWSRVGQGGWDYPMAVYRADGSTTTLQDPSVTQVAATTVMSRLIPALTIWWLRSGERIWKDIIEGMIVRLAELAIDRGEYAFYPTGVFEPGARPELAVAQSASPSEEISDFNVVDYGGGRLIEGLVKYWQRTSFEPAIRLARKLVQAVIRHSAFFDAEGRFLSRQEYTAEGQAVTGTAREVTIGGHFHSHTMVLLNLVEYATAVGDQELLGFTKASYEWARTQGSLLTGFYPTVIDPVYMLTGVKSHWHDELEICELADMIAIGCKLGGADAASRYEDVERWVRNAFAEGQLVRWDWVYSKPRYSDRGPVLPNESADRPAERCVGAFGGWIAGNDYALRMGVMHCCTGNATRALYYVWENMIRCEGGVLSVNLLLNRASQWVDVHSHDPYEGRVDVRCRVECSRVLIRAPEWVPTDSDQITISADGEARRHTWRGRYVDAGAARPGLVLSMSYPIREYGVKEQLGDTIYTLQVKGTTVTGIDPKGRHCPLYLREHYRASSTRWRKARRYIPESFIEW